MTTPNPEEFKTPVSARRRLFQAVAVGGVASVVLPEKWVKPVVDAVIVPAHAAGSVIPVSGIFGNSGPLLADNGRGNLLERFAGLLIPSAHAAGVPASCNLANPNNTCISFNISAFPSTLVNVFADGTSGSATIYPNNWISNTTVGGLTFTNVHASSVAVTGNIGAPNCVTEGFSFPKRTANVCIVT